MRLVDDEEADRAGQQALEELAILESLGSEIEDLALPVLDLAMCLAGLRPGEMRVHRDRVHPMRGELVLLILHEGDQRTHHDREPRQEQRRELVHERLPAPRRHDHDGVASFEYGVDRLPLPLLKVCVPEAVCQDRPSMHFRYGLRHEGSERRNDGKARE